MVTLAEIRQENSRFASEHHEGLVFVFAGATSGIGASTLERMVTMVDASTFYVIGRSTERFSAQRVKLENLNSGIKIVFLEAQFSLISDIDDLCKKVSVAEKKVDYLFMSPGAVPLNGAEYTKEGVETCFAISYYSRMRLASNLLPLLRNSSSARVLNVLSGGREKAILESDIGLEHNWSTRGLMHQSTTMTSLALDYLAANDRAIVFMHGFPGLVRTEIFARQTAPESSRLSWKITLSLIHTVVAITMLIMGFTTEESGERHAFLLTTDKFGPGAWLINEKCEESPAPMVLQRYRETGWTEKIWEHTVRVCDKTLEL